MSVFQKIALCIWLSVIVPSASSVPLGVTCANNSYASAIRALTHQASLVGKDDRKPITEVSDSLGLSTGEVSQIRKSVGFIVCPGTKYKNPASGTAFLVGSNQKLMTVGHAFKEKDGRWREPLSECYFRNQDVPPKRSKLAIGKDGKDLVGGSPTLLSSGLDFAFAKLTEPIANATPLKIEERDDHELVVNEKLLMISALQAGVKNPDYTQPLAQGCVVNQTGYYSSTTIFTDCDLTGGGSGSPVLTRDKNNDLVIRGIMTADGGTEHEGEEYDFAKGNYSKGIGFDAKVSRLIHSYVSK